MIYRWARGEALHLPIETSILGSLQCFRVFLFPSSSSDGLHQNGSLWKKKFDLGRQLPLVNYTPILQEGMYIIIIWRVCWVHKADHHLASTEERPNCMQSWKICLHIPLEVLEGPLQWPQWTSTHQCTIHWMPVTTHLWMNFNRVNTWFHLGNQFCKKWVSYIGK